MGKKSPSVPKPPDPVKTAQAQAAANKEALQESARLNSVNLYGPAGSTTYGFRPDGTPHSQYTQLTPQGQYLFDGQQAIAGQLLNQAYNRTSQIPTTPFSLSSMPYDPRGYNTSSYNMFSPISIPQGQSVPGTFGAGSTQNPESFFGGANNWQAIQGAVNGSKGGQGAPMPAPTGGAPATGGTQFQTSPGSVGGQTTQINNQWFPDSSVYATPNPAQPGTGPAPAPTAAAGTQPAASPTGQGAAAPATAGSSAPSGAGDQFSDRQNRFVNQAFAGKGMNGRSNSRPPPPPQAAPAPAASGPQAPPPPTQAVAPQFPGMPASGAPAQSGAPSGASFDFQSFASSPAGQAMGGKGSSSTPPGGTENGYYPGQPGGSNMNVLPYDPRTYGNINMYVNNVQDAVFDQQARNLRPVFEDQYSRQMQDLADRGLPVGGEAWNSAVGELNRNQSNAWQQVANQAIAAGGEEANRRLGMEQGLRGTAWTEALGTHQQQNSDIQQRLQIEQNLRNQAIQEQILGRNQAFNEAAAFLQGSPALNMPTAPNMPTYQMQAPDVIGATMGAYNAQMQAYNARMAQSGSAWQGAAGIVGGLGSMKSSRTFKHDDAPAERILDRLNLIPIRTWRYNPDIDPRQELHIGPYAEDWKKELGLGNGKEISVIDACGVLMKAVQELSAEISALKAERRDAARKRVAQSAKKKAKKKSKKAGVAK